MEIWNAKTIYILIKDEEIVIAISIHLEKLCKHFFFSTQKISYNLRKGSLYVLSNLEWKESKKTHTYLYKKH
jgi:hypothetical protein